MKMKWMIRSHNSGDTILAMFGFVALCVVMPVRGDTFGNGVVLQPTTASGGTGTVINLQTDDDTNYTVAKSATMTVGGFASGTGAINSVYIFAQSTTMPGYTGTNALQVNGVSTTIVPANRDYGTWRYTEITAGSFGINTWAEIASLSITFTNNDGGSGANTKDALFDCIYIVVNPTSPLPIHPTWLEDFNGTGAANPMVWSYEEGANIRNNELQYYAGGASNGWMEGGNFIIEGRVEAAGGAAYTSASIITINKYYWHFGRAQIRAKIPAKAGMWPAIWGTGEVGLWPHAGEVDIMEYYGNKILANCAVGTTTQWGSKWDSSTRSMTSLQAVDSNWKDEWHIWTMQWDDLNVRLYVDNILMNTIPQTWLKNTDGYNTSWGPQFPFQANGMNCWLNLAMGGNGGDPAATMATGPQRYLIDYWKIWEGATGNVAPANITLDASQIQEGLPAGTVVGNLTAADADPGEVHRWTLVSGTGDTHNSQFVIPEFVSDNTLAGVLKTSQVINYADGATRSIRVRVTDIEGATYTKVLTINVMGKPEIDVSTPSVVVPEGGTATFQVKLRTLPASNVTVNVSRQSGDSDITVSGGASLTFTPTNGTAWQTVTLAAAEDADTTNGAATLICEAPGTTYASKTVDATESENDNEAPVVDAGVNQSLALSHYVSWTPAQITTSLWLDAADAEQVVASNGAVSQWSDKSGNGYHVTQSSASSRPTTGTRAINTRNAIDFDGVDDVLRNTAFTSTDSDFVISVVLELVANTSDTSYRYIYDIPYATDKVIRQQYKGDTATLKWHSVDDTSIGGGTRPSEPILTTLQVEGMVTNAYVNGSLAETTSITAMTDILGISLGARFSPSLNCKVRIGEVIAHDKGEDLTKIEGYLAHKWGMRTKLPDAHPYKSTVPSYLVAIATLTGSATDAESDPLTHTWTMVSGPGSVIFDDATALDTTASFAVVGTYVLRLTADDGISQTSDDITITVSEPNTFTTWAGGTFANPFTVTGYSSNPDGDMLTNLQEFAFGTDPTVSDAGPLSYLAGGDVTGNGTPILENVATPESPDYRAVFLRRKDHVAAGLNYSVQFSAELVQWTVDDTAPTILTGAGSSGDYEAVSVPFPTTVPAHGSTQNLAPHFFRVGVQME